MNKENHKRLTLGSLFSGSGGFELAGQMAGVKPLWKSEVEPFAVAVTQKHFPDTIHYGDISEIDGKTVPPVDIITGGFPCFPAGTLVLTDQGYIEIENVKVGMKVLTHKGRWRKVLAAGSKIGRTVLLKGNHYGLECTPNHPVYSAECRKYYPRKSDGKRTIARYVSKEKEWTPAAEMEGKLWAVPSVFEPLSIPQGHYDGNPHVKQMPPFNEDFFYLVGRWVGDGWVRDGQRAGRPEGQYNSSIIICAGYEKEEQLRQAVDAVVEHYCVERCRTAVKYKFTSQVLCEWLTDNFGKYAYGKEIPAWALTMPERWRRALLQGIFDTDGYRKNDVAYKVSSVSRKLVHGIRLLGETLGYSTTIYFCSRPSTCVIEGRTVNQRDTYTVELTLPKNRSRLSDGIHSWYRVRKVTPTGEEKPVYNMTVEEDNSYIADGIVVHNCQDVSIAGKRSGLEGKRTGLFYEMIRIVKEMREETNGQYPRFIFAENVPGIFSSNKGEDFRVVLEEIIRIAQPEAPPVPPPENGKWPAADVLLGDGWSVAYRTLDTQYWGLPQRRKRVFIVADLTGAGAGEILFKSEGLSGYSAEGFRAWQRAAAGVKGCAGEAGGTATGGGAVVLNDQGGAQIDISEEVTATLRAQEHGHQPCVLDEPCVPEEPKAAGFCTEHSAKARGIGYEEEMSPTLRAGTVPAALYENHSQDTRYTGPLDTAPTVSATYGTGGNNQPFVVEEDKPVTLKIRSGCEGGGKGALLQEDLSATLACNNDQTLFVPKCYGICSKQSHSMLSDNPHSGFYEAETTRCLDTRGGNPTCAQGGMAVVEPDPVYAIQGSMIGREDKNGPQGDGINEEVCFTLNTVDRHAVACERQVAYGIDRAAYNQGVNAKYDFAIEEELQPTMVAKGPGAVAQPEADTAYSLSKASYFTQVNKELTGALVATDYKDPPVVNRPQYSVRRLTPVECARLQGFPDDWCSDLGIEDPTAEQLAFWTEVFETHRRVVTHAAKPKTEKQIRKWLSDPYSDSAAYKLWGNGISLPVVWFVMSGIVWYAEKETGA